MPANRRSNRIERRDHKRDGTDEFADLIANDFLYAFFAFYAVAPFPEFPGVDVEAGSCQN
jgi:hypothetical protein